MLFKYPEARTHLNTCANHQVHQPPPHIPPRGEGELVLRELVSNPPVVWADRTDAPRRLIIHHHNGRQVVSRMVPTYRTMADWRRQVADLTGSDPANIKMFRFDHQELKDPSSVADICRTRGATWLASFDATHPDFQQFRLLGATSAFLTLYEPGQAPVTPRAADAGEEQPQQEWW